MFKRTTLSLALTLAAASASATSYYVVVPLPARTVSVEGISVGLAGTTLPAGMVGQEYPTFDFKSLLTVSGDPTYTGYGLKWRVKSGQLPAGLTLSASGVLSGTPAASGAASFELEASYKTKTGQRAYQVVVADITVGLAGGAAPEAYTSQAYHYDLKPLLSVGGDAGYNGSGVTWTVVSNTLPAGLYLRNDGAIVGTPTAGGTGRITARASYKGASGEQSYQVVVLDIRVTLAHTVAPTELIVGQPFMYDMKNFLFVSGDSSYTPASVTWSIQSGTLPAGLTLAANGIISGTPTADGNHYVTIRASYKGADGQQTYQVISRKITVALATATPTEGIVGKAYSYDLKQHLTVAGDPAYAASNVTWTVISSSLPAGLTLRADGTITGTPTAASAGSVTARASYRGVNGQQTYEVVSRNITVSLADATPTKAIVGQAYAYDLKQHLTVSGDPNYTADKVTWSYTSNTLPAGLSLTAQGVVSGTPTVAGSGSLTARAAYKGITFDKTYSFATGDPLTVVAGNQALASTTGSTLLVSESADDTNIGIGIPPFTIKWFGQSYSSVYVGSNSYITFGGGSNSYTSLSLTSLGLPGVMFGAADNSYQRVWSMKGSLNGVPFVRLRYEGNGSTSGIVGSPGIVAELTLFAPQPTRQLIQLKVGVHNRPDGVFGVISPGSGAVSGGNIQPNTSYVFESDANGHNWKITTGAYVK